MIQSDSIRRILPRAIKNQDDAVVDQCLEFDREFTAVVMDILPFPNDLLDNPNAVRWVLDWRDRIRSSWSTPDDEQKAYLHAIWGLYWDGQLLPVAGAGISKPAGFPLWGELTKDCLLYARRHAEPEDVQQVVTAFDQLNSKDYTDAQLKEATDAFVTAARGKASIWLQNLLQTYYKRLPGLWAPVAPTRLHDRLAALHHAARPSITGGPVGLGGPGIRGIVTYNFDQMLELAMTNRRCGVEVFFSKQGAPVSLLQGDIQGDYPFPIVHAHGFIPMQSEPVRPEGWIRRPDVLPAQHADSEETIRLHDVVFSQSSYKVLYANADGVPKLVHKEILGRAGSLFIGCSLKDDAVLNELLEAKEQSPLNTHFAVFQDESHVLDDFGEYRKARDHFLHYGIRPFFIKDHDDLPILLDGLRKQGAAYIRKCRLAGGG
ncbi:SIR2 family protein [Arthrobacter sp. NPDC093125]|uniref:SIR2 family protein n=1 Tax=Arthrobacter sp. NPDC093125 TaxID=3363944 RepID=UPI0037F5EF2F